MRKQELAQCISERLKKLGFGGSETDVEFVTVLVEALLREIFLSVAEGRTVSIRGFGTFKPKQYKGNTKAEKFLPNKPRVTPKECPAYFARPTFRPGTILRNEIK